MVKSAYIHIPFCTHICSYCDFCKMYYEESLVNDYLDCLDNEIQENYRGEKLRTIYIGGGTPSSLTERQLKKLFEILSQLKTEENYEYTIELNAENTTLEKLKLCYEFGVNRLSFGVETSNDHLLQQLNRHHTKEQIIEMIALAKEVGFQNINVDLMYGLPNEVLEDVEKDLKFIDSLEVQHVSTYSLILEEHTKFFLDQITGVSEKLEEKMYQLICKHLQKNGFEHYEISNFAVKGFQSQHNLVYWNNEEYYGFGLGASGYIDHIRYCNTKSIKHYFSGKRRKEEECVSKIDEMSYEMILGLRKLEGVSKMKFQEKFHQTIQDVFHYQEHLDSKNLIEDGDFLKIAEDKIYVSNEILETFVGSDKNE